MLPGDDVPGERQARDALAGGLVSAVAVERAGPGAVDCDHRRADVVALGTGPASTQVELLDERQRAAVVHHERGDVSVGGGVRARSHAVDGAPVPHVHREDLVVLAVGIEDPRCGEPDVVADDHRWCRVAEPAVLRRRRGEEQRDPVCRAPAAVELRVEREDPDPGGADLQCGRRSTALRELGLLCFRRGNEREQESGRGRREREARARHRATLTAGALSQAAHLSRLTRANETEGAIMKIFVAGATGVLGRALVPQLVARGHEVVGMTRSASKQDLLRRLGARPAVADALDPDAVGQAVAPAPPEVIVHELTALSGPMSVRDMRHPDRSAAATMTNRLRIEGTDHLLAAGRAVGARRFVAQSFGAFRFARTGGPVLTEADPLDPDPPAALRPAVVGLLHLEQAVTPIEWGGGPVLRYGSFYGPGTAISREPDALMAAPIRKRRFPIIGDGGGVLSHIHIDDAAAATVIAVERGRPGIYYIVDDEPAPVREWLPVLATALDAKPPRRIPPWLGRLAA